MREKETVWESVCNSLSSQHVGRRPEDGEDIGQGLKLTDMANILGCLKTEVLNRLKVCSVFTASSRLFQDVGNE